MFRNVRFYCLDGNWPDSEKAVSEKLMQSAFEPCGPLTERRSGWVPIDAESSDSLARRVNGADLMKLRSQSRVLPAAAINEELEKRIDEYQARMKEKPGRREGQMGSIVPCGDGMIDWPALFGAALKSPITDHGLIVEIETEEPFEGLRKSIDFLKTVEI